MRQKVINRISTDDKFREKMSKVNKSFSVEFDGTTNYNFRIENGNIGEIMEGKKDADIAISVDSETFRKILSNETDAMSAYFEKKLRIKASLMDKLLLSDIFK